MWEPASQLKLHPHLIGPARSRGPGCGSCVPPEGSLNQAVAASGLQATGGVSEIRGYLMGVLSCDGS